MTLVRGDWFYILLIFIDGFFMTRPYLYAIQQDNYRIGEIFKTKRLRFVYFIDVCAVVVFTAVWTLFYFLQARAFWGFVIALFFFITELAMYFMEDLPTRKKPLKYTKRAVRCLVFVSLCATAVMSCALAVANVRLSDVYMRYLIFFAYPLIFPLIFMVSGSVINVFERLNNYRYERASAKALSRQSGLLKIAITGSFGKTSVKNYLHAMLSQKYNVLTTPASFNTPMGIAKTVASLDGTQDIFIAEFGARRRGDIKKLMKIVSPQYTLLTGINSQHLETFKTEENIKLEKCRILHIPKNGFCVANCKLRETVEQYIASKHISSDVIFGGYIETKDTVRAQNALYDGQNDGFENFDNGSNFENAFNEDGDFKDGFEKCDARSPLPDKDAVDGSNFRIYARNVRADENGTAFELVADGRGYSVRTALLGKHNIENILLAASMAYELGVEIIYIVDAIENLQPVPHRMQLIYGNGIKIIDDSFNSNPDGAECALDTLKMFEGRKVVLTPGLVELGGKETEENYRLGRKMSETCDLALLVGTKRTDPIKRGLLDGGYGGEIHIYESLKSAEEDFVNRLNVGDVLLILNDLPDIYDEKISKR